MAFSFNPLLKLLIDKKMNREDLRTALGFSPATMAKMTKGEYVSMEVIHKICEYFTVQPNEILEYIPDRKKTK
jgi:putative transcriptional regulator